jgi:hypothetical protein
MRTLRRFVLVLLTTVVGLVAVAPAAHAQPRTVIFDLYPSPLVTPQRVFFTADAGPYLKDLMWTGWGTDTATGTGTYELNCSNGGPSCGNSTAVTDYPATYTLTGLIPCPRFGAAGTTYRTGTVTVDRPASAGSKTFDFSSDYDFCAKLPTKAAAATVIKKFIRRHGAIRKFTIKCRKSGDTDLTCTVHYTQKGKRKVRYFDIFGRVSKSPHLIQIYSP